MAGADYIFHGEGLTDVAGGSLARVGDTDGDGTDDFLVSAYWNDEAGVNAGKIYLVRGSDLGADQDINLADASAVFLGEDGVKDTDTCYGEVGGSIDTPDVCGGDWAGHSVAPAGDVDGDELADFLVSGYGNDDEGLDRGRIYLVLAADILGGGSWSLGESAYLFAGETDADRMGHSVAMIDDMDGDGASEVMTGAYGNDQAGFDAGKAYLWMGHSLGAPGQRLLASEADYGFLGEEAIDNAGYFVANLGDVDGDGGGDLAVVSLESEDGGEGRGPSGERGSGKVTLVMASDLGAPGLRSLLDLDRAFFGEAGGDTLGYGTASAGDVDGDGLPDILLGAYGNDDGGEDAGKAYVVLAASLGGPGHVSVAAADIMLTGGAHDLAGQSNEGVGDLDGDGLGDLLVSARRDYAGRDEAGSAWLVLASSLGAGGTWSLSDVGEHQFEGEEAWDQAGYKVSGAGDVDGDGLPDLLVGAWQGDRMDQTGKVYLLLTPSI
jgi:hypothetical protein